MTDLQPEMFPAPVIEGDRAEMVIWIPEGCSPDGLLEALGQQVLAMVEPCADHLTDFQRKTYLAGLMDAAKPHFHTATRSAIEVFAMRFDNTAQQVLLGRGAQN